MSSSHSDEEVSNACDTLQTSIDRFLKKRVRKEPLDDKQIKFLRREVRAIVDHLRHLLSNLNQKRHSLTALLGWFEGEWRRTKDDLLEEHPILVLESFMKIFLRCRDGLTLLTSGECRHQGDKDAARASDYPSQLPKVGYSDDGYTRMYSPDYTYSGYGWDEFANKKVGIQIRLCKLFRLVTKKPLMQIWEYLVENGAPMVENILERHESEMAVLQSRIATIKSTFLRDVSSSFCTLVTFSTTDLIEKMTIKLKEGNKITRKVILERRSEAFQIRDPRGILPADMKTIEDWNVLRLVVRVKNSTQNPKPGKRQKLECSNLAVRVHSTESSDADRGASITEIKSKMGVSTEKLEAARETLEDEIAKTDDHAKAIDAKEGDLTDDDNIERATNLVLKLRSDLKTIKQKPDVDDDMIWNVRESLREACMDLGNMIMWSDDSCIQSFKQSIDYFAQAEMLVEEQIKFHDALCKKPSHVASHDPKMIGRNLLLLHAQALTNQGIAFVELSRCQVSKVHNSKQGIEKFEAAQARVATMRNVAIEIQFDKTNTERDYVEIVTDIFKADQLESLILRWTAVALWPSDETRAENTINQAAAFCALRQLDNVIRKEKQCMDVYLEMTAECIYAKLAFADLVRSSMEKLPTMQRGPSWVERGDRLLGLLKDALKTSYETAEAVEDSAITGASVSSFFEDYDIPGFDEMAVVYDEMNRWWSQIKEAPPDTSPRLPPKPSATDSRRGDLFSNGVPGRKFPATEYLIVKQPRQQRKKLKTSKGRGSAAGASSTESMEQTQARKLRRARPRKWGDESFPKKINKYGETVPDLPYPSVAPEMPAEFKALVAQGKAKVMRG